MQIMSELSENRRFYQVSFSDFGLIAGYQAADILYMAQENEGGHKGGEFDALQIAEILTEYRRRLHEQINV